MTYSDWWGLAPKCDPPQDLDCDNPNAIEALFHYVGRSGTPLTQDFTKLDTSPAENLIGFPQVDAAFSKRENGTFTIDDKTTIAISGAKGLALGTITLHVDGILTTRCDPICSYAFEGKLTALNDVYDFNKSTHRSSIGESMTNVGRYIPGVTYEIEFMGSKRIAKASTFWTDT